MNAADSAHDLLGSMENDREEFAMSELRDLLYDLNGIFDYRGGDLQEDLRETLEIYEKELR